MDAPSKRSPGAVIGALVFMLVLAVGAGVAGVVILGGTGAAFYILSAPTDITSEPVDGVEAPVEPGGEGDEASPDDEAGADDEATLVEDGQEGSDEGESDEDAAADESAAPKKRRPRPAPAAPAAPEPDLPPAVSEDVPDDMVGIKIRHTDPGVTVIIDGAVAGKTPLSVRVETGSHQLRLVDGKASGQFNIDAGFMQATWCFQSKGKKVDETDC